MQTKTTTTAKKQLKRIKKLRDKMKWYGKMYTTYEKRGPAACKQFIDEHPQP